MNEITPDQLKTYLGIQNRIDDRATQILKAFRGSNASLEKVVFHDNLVDIHYGWSACGSWTNDEQEITVEAFFCKDSEVELHVDYQLDKERQEAKKAEEIRLETRRVNDQAELERLKKLYPTT